MKTRFGFFQTVTLSMAATLSLVACSAATDPMGESDESVEQAEEGATVLRSRFERDVDTLVTAMGEHGVGCAPHNGRSACASTARQPTAIEVGDHFRRDVPPSLCYEDASGALSSCTSLPPSEYDCPIGWNTCDCYDFVDCLEMVWMGECVEGTFWCGPEKCHCQASS